MEVKGFTVAPGETEPELIYRISSLRGQHPELPHWKSVAEVLNGLLGKEHHPSTYLRRYQKLHSLVGSFDAVVQERKEQALTIEKERIKNRDILREMRMYIRDEARIEVLIDKMVDSIEALPPIVSHVPELKPGGSGILMISDWHLGACFKHSANEYSSQIANQRLQKLLNHTIYLIKQQKLSTLHVLNLGDMIDGLIHVSTRIQAELDAVEATMHVSEMIANFLAALSEHVEVKYHYVLDNHSRVIANKKEHIEKESFGKLIHWYLRARLVGTPIRFEDSNIDDNIGYLEVEDHKFAFVHGHLDKPGPANAKLSKMVGTFVDYVLMAHYHDFKAMNGVIINGSMMGPNEYAYNLRLINKPEQIMLTFDMGNMNIHKIDLT